MATNLTASVNATRRPPRQVKPGTPPGRTGGPGGQPPFVATDAQRVQVRRLTACGFTQDSISVITSIPTATLERHFAFELQHGKLMTDAKVLGGIITMAEEGDKTMSIFWAKARAGWRDVGKDADASSGNTVFSINISNASSNASSGPTIEHEPPHSGGNDMRITVSHRLESEGET